MNDDIWTDRDEAELQAEMDDWLTMMPPELRRSTIRLVKEVEDNVLASIMGKLMDPFYVARCEHVLAPTTSNIKIHLRDN